MCCELLTSVYGMRDAASNGEETYTRPPMKNGWIHGLSSPCVFTHPSGGRLAVHGDEFTFAGADAEPDNAHNLRDKQFKVKSNGRLGPDRGDDKTSRILNRCRTWTRN